MTYPNPFASQVPATTEQAPAQQQNAPAPNPFAQQQAPQVPQQGAPNPYAPAAAAVAQQQHPVQQVYAQQAPAPQQGAPNPYAGGTSNPYAQPAVPAYGNAYSPPPGVSHMQHVQQTYQGQQQAAQAQQNYATAQHNAAQPLPQLGAASAPPPPVSGGGKGAKLADMYGRLVVIFPLALQRVPKNARFVTDADRANGNLEQDRMTATVIVLDDGQGGHTALAWGGAPHALGGAPHTEFSPLPYVRKGMWLNQSQLIGQLSPYLPGRERGGPNNAPGAAVGRLVKTGPDQNAPWFLTTPTEAEINLANNYLGLVSEGRYPHPLAP